MHLRSSALLIQGKIRGHRCNVLLPAIHIFLQRMAADIDAQHLFFKGKHELLGVLVHIGQFGLEALLFLLAHQVKKGKLAGHHGLLALGHAIHDPCVGYHKLLPVAAEAV